MDKLAKNKSIIIYILIIISILFMFSKFIVMKDYILPINLGYVYSGSMEPTIRTNDGYILIYAKTYHENDIITYKPSVLKETYVTHRIIQMTEDNKFVTKGDNNQSTDQDGGEPLVNSSQIMGKVFSINNKLLIIPNLGAVSKKFNTIIEDLNIFILLAVCIGLFLLEYVIDNFLTKNKRSTRKNKRLLDIAPFFDVIFILLCIMIFINAIFIGLTIKSWNSEKSSFIVVATKGLSSPLPGEEFTKTMSLENTTFIPFITILEPENKSIEVSPKKLSLRLGQNVEYTLTMKAPDTIGYYIELISKRTYPDILPDKWLDFLYTKNEVLPLVLIFTPSILINIILCIWWFKRWQIGRREIMGWLIPFRAILKN